MSQKTRLPSALLNSCVVAGLLAICAVSLYLFFYDLNSSSIRTDKTMIATVNYKYKVAQRKFNDRVLWERVQQNSPLYDGDTLRTADLALATIYFSDGAIIELSENTMVHIALGKNGELNVSVGNGNVDIDTTSSLTSINLNTSDGKYFTVEKGSKISASLDQSMQNLGISMSAGKAFFVDANGLITEYGSGDSMTVYADGSVSRKPITVSSVSENQRILMFEKNRESFVNLEWFENENTAGKVIVQISKTDDFSEVEDSYYITESNKCDVPCGDGTTYWRIYAEGKESEASEGKFTVNFADEIVPVYPEDGSQFRYFNEKPKVAFNWKGNDFASRYKIEISRYDDFSVNYFTRELQGKSIIVTNISEGIYFWKVTPYYSINRIGWYGESKTMKFVVSKLTDVPSPSQMFPADGSRLSYDQGETNVKSFFSWKSDEIKSDDSHVIIARDTNFTDVVRTIPASENSVDAELRLNEFKDGDYYWKVVQNLILEETGKTKTVESEARKFTVGMSKPESDRLLLPQDSFTVEKSLLSGLTFMWKTASKNSLSSKLQFSSSSDFTSVVLETDEVTSDSIKNISLNEGKYYWRIENSYKDKSGETRKKYSDSRKLYVVGGLSNPVLKYPSSNEKISIRNITSVDVDWNGVEGADYYKVRLLDSSNNIMREYNCVESTNLSIPSENSLFESGKSYSVSVQAFARESKSSSFRMSPVSTVSFSMKSPSPVKLLSPAMRAFYPGLDALKNGVNLSWTEDEDQCARSTLFLWKVTSGNKLSLVKSYTNPSKKIHVPRLGEGQYRWTVKAVSRDGSVIDAKDSFDFTVGAVPVLPKAALEIPTGSEIIGPEYLKKNRSIYFQWSPVAGATDYTFDIYTRNDDGTLRKIWSKQKIRNSSLNYKNLSSLDVGTFMWQVTAFNREKDGFVLQKGKASTGIFKIDFETSGNVEAMDPGVMYGE